MTVHFLDVLSSWPLPTNFLFSFSSSPFPLPLSLPCSIAPPHFFTPSPLPPFSLISSSLAICLMLYHSGWSCISVVSRSLSLLGLGIEAPYKHLQIMHRPMTLIGQAKMKLATWYCACTKQLDKFYLHFSWHCQELAKSLKITERDKQNKTARWRKFSVLFCNDDRLPHKS